ncbi:MAG: helix-turn-helix transcriptional regulator [Ruminococcaceae bacterium]|nr:helix-turn-helix transcriptional regulator [Oscillospiraceae bacterium]
MIIPDYSLSYFYCDRTSRIKSNIQDYRQLPRPHYAITYIVGGVGEIVSEERRDPIGPGDLMLTPMGSRYTQVWEDRNAVDHISCRFIFRKQPHFFANRQLYVQKLSGFADTLPDFLYIFEHLNQTDALFSVMTRFYSILEKTAPLFDGHPLPCQDAQILFAADYISDNLGRHIAVEELARLTHLSVSHFYSRFRKAMNCSPIEYKQRLAVQSAQRMLSDERGLSIEEIGRRVGFESPSYFRRIFASVSGMTPGKYRAQLDE